MVLELDRMPPFHLDCIIKIIIIIIIADRLPSCNLLSVQHENVSVIQLKMVYLKTVCLPYP